MLQVVYQQPAPPTVPPPSGFSITPSPFAGTAFSWTTLSGIAPGGGPSARAVLANASTDTTTAPKMNLRTTSSSPSCSPCAAEHAVLLVNAFMEANVRACVIGVFGQEVCRVWNDSPMEQRLSLVTLGVR